MTYTKLSRDAGMALDYERANADAPALTLKAAQYKLRQLFNGRQTRRTMPYKAGQEKGAVHYART